MLKAKELLERGQLSAAIGQVTQDVKSKPADARARIFLFELLCLSGELERAEKQLEALGHQSAEMQIGTEVYRQVLQAEKQRRAVFDDGLSPTFLIEPPPYASLHIEALTLQREKNPGRARAVLEQAMELEPALSGKVDEQPFAEFSDSDVFL
jgi:type VI secretion system protein ImpE